MMTTYLEQGSTKISDPIATHSRFPVNKVSASLLTVIQSASEGVIIIDATRQIVLVNKQAERMFGYPAAHLLDRSVDIILPPRLGAEQRRRVDRFAAVRMSGKRSRIGFRGLSASGEEIPITACISRVTVHGEMYLVAILRNLKTGTGTQNGALQRHRMTRTFDMRQLAVSTQQAHEVEKRRFSKELYDDIGQRLSVLKLDLDWLEDRLPDNDRVFPERVAQMQGILDKVITMTKSMASTLRPPLLDDFGLLPAVEWMTENFRKKTSIAVSVHGTDMKLKLQEPVESAVFRVIQEALTNIEKHAHATRVDVELRCLDGELKVKIQDDGIGLGPESENKPGCYGLIAMQERIFVLGGTIAIQNTKPRGLAIHASIPIDPLPVE